MPYVITTTPRSRPLSRPVSRRAVATLASSRRDAPASGSGPTVPPDGTVVEVGRVAIEDIRRQIPDETLIAMGLTRRGRPALMTEGEILDAYNARQS